MIFRNKIKGKIVNFKPEVTTKLVAIPSYSAKLVNDEFGLPYGEIVKQLGLQGQTLVVVSPIKGNVISVSQN